MSDRLKLSVRNNQADAHAPQGESRYRLRKSRNTWRVTAIALAVMLAIQSFNILNGSV